MSFHRHDHYQRHHHHHPHCYDPTAPTPPCLPHPRPAGLQGLRAASPSSDSGLSAGDGLLIAFFVILAVYMIAGMLLNYRAGATGVELVRNLSFWKSLPGLIKDGCRFAFVDLFGLRTSHAEYQPVGEPRRAYGAI